MSRIGLVKSGWGFEIGCKIGRIGRCRFAERSGTLELQEIVVVAAYALLSAYE